MALHIRDNEYRGVQGFLISGRDCWGRSVSVFVKTLPAAEHIRAKLERGKEITVADFDFAGLKVVQ